MRRRDFIGCWRCCVMASNDARAAADANHWLVKRPLSERLRQCLEKFSQRFGRERLFGGPQRGDRVSLGGWQVRPVKGARR